MTKASKSSDKQELIVRHTLFWKEEKLTKNVKDLKMIPVLQVLEEKLGILTEEIGAISKKVLKQLILLLNTLPSNLVRGILLTSFIEPIKGDPIYFQSSYNSQNKFLWNSTRTSSNLYDQETLEICLTKPLTSTALPIQRVLTLCWNGYIDALAGSSANVSTDPTLSCINSRYGCDSDNTLAIAVGVIIGVVCFLGICGACCKQFCYKKEYEPLLREVERPNCLIL